MIYNTIKNARHLANLDLRLKPQEKYKKTTTWTTENRNI